MQRCRAFDGHRPWLWTVVIGLAAMLAGPVHGQNMRFFKIGTASTSGTYFPVGGLLANAISHPPGSRACGDGGNCGVPNLIAVVTSTKGSVDNVRRMADGKIPSALVQGDIAYWAYTGTWLFADTPRVPGLRAIANLYPEAIHLVVDADSGIDGVADLKGKRVSVGPAGSGTHVDAELILKAHGVPLDAIKQREFPVGLAADRLREDRLDAFFFVGGPPASAITNLAQSTDIRLVSIAGVQAARLASRYPYLDHHTISADTYPGIGEIKTLAVGAQWLVHKSVDSETVYAITKALWHPQNRNLFKRGHPQAGRINLKTALDRLAVPLHAGAKRFYAKKGVVKSAATADGG